MSVTETVVLPAQPAVGFADFVPLGGDGWSSPQSMVIIRDFVLAGDATGGTSTFFVETDARFSCIVPWIQIGVVGATAAEDFSLALTSRLRQSQGQNVQLNGETQFTTLGGGFCFWSTPPVIDVDRFQFTFNNTDGDSHVMNAIVYNYQLRASEKVPISILLDVLPRGHASTP